MWLLRRGILSITGSLACDSKAGAGVASLVLTLTKDGIGDSPVGQREQGRKTDLRKKHEFQHQTPLCPSVS